MNRRRTGRPLAVLALLIFGGLAALPWIHGGSATPPWAAAARSSSPVALPAAPPALHEVSLGQAATPVRPDDDAALPPGGDSTRMAALVAGEDLRLRLLLHHSGRILGPTVVPLTGALPTLVLRARPIPYSIDDLVNAGAATPLSDGTGYLIVDSVLVETGATLSLGGGGVSQLLLASSSAGITSLVVWGGTLTLTGDSADRPLTVMGWDQANARIADTEANGRPYIRDVGGRMDLRFVHASYLGFWSGRTGGVSWTGISSHDATGGAVSCTFTNSTYGAFVSRADHVSFTDDLFESNELDGVRLHRSAQHSTILRSAAVRNGGNGFVVSRGATGDVLDTDLALHNRGNGFLLDGQPLVSGASPSGAQTVASQGTVVQNSEARSNLRSGIIVEGGAGTLIRDNLVCSADGTAVAVRAGASGTTVVGNDVECGHIALSIGPSVSGTTISSNLLTHARIGILIRNAPGVRLMSNYLSAISVFGISVRGTSAGVVGNDNVISGLGLQPLDYEANAPQMLLLRTDIRGWEHRSQPTFLSYLRYHPMLTAWSGVVLLALLIGLLARLRRGQRRPYRHSVSWSPAGLELETLAAVTVGAPASGSHLQQGGANGAGLPGASLVGRSSGRAIDDRGVADGAPLDGFDRSRAIRDTLREATRWDEGFDP